MKREHGILLGCLFLMLQGCTAFDGPRTLFTSSGPQYKADPKNPNHDSFQQLLSSFAAAAKDADDISTGAASEPTSSTGDISIRAHRMAVDGVNLVEQNCRDFFLERGNDQMILNLARDTTGASGSLASGILSLASPANAVASAILSLSTSTASNALDIYTKNFLFGSDNIENVRTMTLAALAAHRNAAMPDHDNTVWSYGGAATVIMDHQDICTPAQIRSLVLASIANSKMVANKPATSDQKMLQTAVDAAAAAAPGVSNTAAVAAAAVAAALPDAQTAAQAEIAKNSSSAVVNAAAAAAASSAVNSVVQDRLAGNPSSVQQSVTSALTSVIANEASDTAPGSASSPDRHIEVQVAR